MFMADYSDVLIIGAGISGIGAAHRIGERNPDLSYTILERRERVGGTWTCSDTREFGPTATSTRCASRGSHGLGRR